jgi:hypothetical protein
VRGLMPARTTICRSPSGLTSCWRGSARSRRVEPSGWRCSASRDRARPAAPHGRGRFPPARPHRQEFQLLEYFLLHPEEVVRRTALLEKVWDMHFDPEQRGRCARGQSPAEARRAHRGRADRDGARRGVRCGTPLRRKRHPTRSAHDRHRPMLFRPAAARQCSWPACSRVPSRASVTRHLLWSAGLYLLGIPLLSVPPAACCGPASMRTWWPVSPFSSHAAAAALPGW